jgi:hypothetical protein
MRQGVALVAAMLGFVAVVVIVRTVRTTAASVIVPRRS